MSSKEVAPSSFGPDLGSGDEAKIPLLITRLFGLSSSLFMSPFFACYGFFFFPFSFPVSLIVTDAFN